jgi:hypothetical protein
MKTLKIRTLQVLGYLAAFVMGVFTHALALLTIPFWYIHEEVDNMLNYISNFINKVDVMVATHFNKIKTEVTNEVVSAETSAKTFVSNVENAVKEKL